MNTSGAAFDSFNVAAERQVGRYGDKPFLTWYDDHRDERIELSYRTFDNWVAKTANLLVDERDPMKLMQLQCDVPVEVAWDDVTPEYTLPKFRIVGQG